MEWVTLIVTSILIHYQRGYGSSVGTIRVEVFGVKYGPRNERIGAMDAALNDERSAHKNRAERVHSSLDALWGRWSDVEIQELVYQSRSDSASDKKLVNGVLHRENQAVGTIITGPDAGDVYVVGEVGDER